VIRQSHPRSHFGSALFGSRSLPRLSAPQARVLAAVARLSKPPTRGVRLSTLACLLYARKDRKPAWSIRYVRIVMAVLVRVKAVEVVGDGEAVRISTQGTALLKSGRHPKVLTIPG
jgi:hypothetical protein